MRQTGIAVLGIMLLLFGHGKAFSQPVGLGIPGDAAYKQEYADYTKAVRVKIGDNFSKKLDVAEAGTVSLDFEISSDGKLVQVTVNNDKTKASPKMIATAIMAVKQSAPFGPFPQALARDGKLPFSILLNLKPTSPQF